MRLIATRPFVAGAVALLLMTACDDNPVDEGVDEVDLIRVENRFVTVGPGDSIRIAASPTNQYGAVVPADVAFEACDDKLTIGEVFPDSIALTGITNAWVKGTSDLSNIGLSCVEMTAGSAIDTVRVLVVPGYPVTDVDAAAAGEIVTITRAQGQPEFDANTTIQFEDILLGTRTAFIVSKTADEIQFVVPYSIGEGERTLTIAGAGASNANLSGDFEITTAADPDDTEFEAERMVDVPFEIYSKVTDEDVDDVYEFVAPQDGTLDVYLDWDEGAADLDLYLLDDAYTDLHHGWFDHPEHFQEEVTAGETYYIYVNNFEGGPSTYHLRVQYEE